MRKQHYSQKITQRNSESAPYFSKNIGNYFKGAALGLGVVFAMNTQVFGQDNALLQKEIQRRAENVSKANELLSTGDKAYNDKEYKLAVESYKEAFSLIPKGNRTHALKSATGERYAKAAVEYGKVLARSGQYVEARKHLNDVLSKDVAPDNVGALKMLNKLDDPIRFSPTLTPEHTRNIEKVGKLLRKGDSYILQAQYSEALVIFEEVLMIDPYNKAARRGMERVARHVREYSDAAYDQTRSTMLAEIDSQWERHVLKDSPVPQVGEIETDALGNRIQDVAGSKLQQIIVPIVDFDGLSLEEALNQVRVWARELDVVELDPELRGINFVSRLGDKEAGFRKKIEEQRVNLELKNVPLSVVLDYITQQTGTYWREEQFAVVIRPIGSFTEELETRTFRVPFGFVDELSSAEQSDDPFGDSPALQPKAGVAEGLQKIGIKFADGATAFYDKTNSTLRVTNSPQELDAIEDYIRGQALQESVAVIIKTTIIDVSSTTLNELGYDWLIDPNQINNNYFLGGGTQGTGDFISASPSSVGGAAVNGDAVTSGLRSGDGAFSANSIDGLVTGLDDGGAQRASSPLALTGQISDTTFQTILRAISQKSGLDTIQQSTTVSTAGQRVELRSGRDFIYPTEYEPPEVPNTAGAGSPITPSNPTAFETREVGYSISVEPTVSEDRNYISLSVNPSIVNFDGFIDYGSPINSVVTNPITGAIEATEITPNAILQPVFSNTTLNTSVTLQDGATMVLGGLIQDRIETVEDKVPILGDLPLVGRFFESNGIRNQKRAIVIFVHAELVDPTGQKWRDR